MSGRRIIRGSRPASRHARIPPTRRAGAGTTRPRRQSSGTTRSSTRAPACPRVPICLLDEIRTGVVPYIRAKGERWAIFGKSDTKALATRKHKAVAEELLQVARSEAALGGTEVDPQRRNCTVYTPLDKTGEPAHYQLVEVDDLVPSHDPWTFQPDDRYPKGVQEREYHRQAEEKKKVTMGGQNLQPDLIINDCPTAVDGPPLVAAGGPPWFALGGNGRSMMLRRAYADRGDAAEAFRQELIHKAPEFGFSSAEVEQFRQPVIVRVMEDVPATAPIEALVAAVRRFNEGMTQQLSAKVRAVAEAKQLRASTVAALGELLASSEGSLRTVLTESPREVIEILERDGIVTPENRAQFVAGGGIAPEARERIEGMFLGKIIGTGDRLANTSDSLLAKLERAVPYLIQVAGINPALDLIPQTQAAVDLLNDARIRGESLWQHVRQTGMQFLGGAPIGETARLAEMLQDTGQREIGLRFKRWAARVGQDPNAPRMFETVPTAADHELLYKQTERKPRAVEVVPGPGAEARMANPRSGGVTTLEGPYHTTRALALALGGVPDSGFALVKKGPMLLSFKGTKCVSFVFAGKSRPKLARDLTKDIKSLGKWRGTRSRDINPRNGLPEYEEQLDYEDGLNDGRTNSDDDVLSFDDGKSIAQVVDAAERALRGEGKPKRYVNGYRDGLRERLQRREEQSREENPCCTTCTCKHRRSNPHSAICASARGPACDCSCHGRQHGGTATPTEECRSVAHAVPRAGHGAPDRRVAEDA
jgi:hypothetical protein